MTDLYLIRHADSIFAPADGRHRDLGLSADGAKQAERLRERLARTGEIAPEAVIASPARSARETAQVLAPQFAAPVTLDPAFGEWRRDDGSLGAAESAERWGQVPAAQRPFARLFDGGESWVEFSARVQGALDRVLREQAGKPILLLTHAGVIQAAFEYFFGYGLAGQLRAGVESRHTAITHWLKPADSDAWVLERHNDHQHLE
ncbi:MAG TPA: histidine phosphatase family protein [Herpetosiphonaceae bacterium]|nr:histidine phosphatase family protein [Herpetosiphonaceae bacterium]